MDIIGCVGSSVAFGERIQVFFLYMNFFFLSNCNNICTVRFLVKKT